MGAFLYLKWAFPKALKGVVPKFFPGASPPDPLVSYPPPHFVEAGSAAVNDNVIHFYGCKVKVLKANSMLLANVRSIISNPPQRQSS